MSVDASDCQMCAARGNLEHRVAELEAGLVAAEAEQRRLVGEMGRAGRAAAEAESRWGPGDGWGDGGMVYGAVDGSRGRVR